MALSHYMGERFAREDGMRAVEVFGAWGHVEYDYCWTIEGPRGLWESDCGEVALDAWFHRKEAHTRVPRSDSPRLPVRPRQKTPDVHVVTLLHSMMVSKAFYAEGGVSFDRRRWPSLRYAVFIISN